ncbi:ankyrin repeats (3 copies) domain-containing protein [Trichoderma breve]|uniref:Ankyrin repeats (3 copies) domain-containing protein n=1 Tax=Trichoderma breve TaxID=2034170 RepID=A0A9W9E2F7_9HYPO|nr:ankyrin repeats (3 copies) domain-containing protein [Trichoderma breve]KAJ4854240.1 ankyrin repeats (3 copies) domain-containing protein [Trichoderma breve]
MNAHEARPDYYDILKVPVWAETDEIRTSYKRLALAHHPDKDPNNPNATAFFQSIQAAHSTLTDPAQRSAYDREVYMDLDFALHRFRERKKEIKEHLRINIQNEVARHRVIEYEKRTESPSCPSARRIKHEAASKKFKDVIVMQENQLASLKAEINKMKVTMNAMLARGYKPGNVNYNHYASTNAETPPGQVDNVLKCLYKSPYKDRKDRNPRRVQADPGCGKSVLVRHLIDSVVQTTTSRTVCYFFFKDDFPDQKNVASALCCILRQIFMQKPSLLSEAILKRFNTGGETFNASFSELWQTFLQVVEDENAGEIVCLLDAIDECEDHSDQGRSQLLKALCALYGTERSFNIKFLITSRPYVEIHRGLQPLDIPGLPVIHLSGESEDEMKKISQEINVYIGARVQDIGRRLQLTQNECSLLLQRLMHIPNRTYLWVYLTLDLIESSINVTEKMILEATSNVPKTIDEAYERILSRSSNTRQARIILHIIVAAARPLTVKEMNFALASSETRQPHPDMDLVPDDRFRENLRNICGLCIVIVDSKVYLLHQTVKEFLVKRNMTKTLQSESDDYEWKYSIQPQESHIILAKICIWHLLAGSQLLYESTSHAWRDTFLDYSAKYWVSHFREMDSEAQSMLTKSILTICDEDSFCCKTWFAVHWSTMQTNCPRGFTTLMIASYFGLHFAVQSLLDMDVDLDAQDKTYERSALCWAVRNGFWMVAELLISGPHEYGRTPLTYAIWNGDVALVKLLLKAGANVHLKDTLDKTPLFYAFCNNGHEEVVMQLIKTGRANLEARNNLDETILISAIRAYHKAIVKMLLEAGANPNAKDRYRDPALFVAIYSQKAAVDSLLSTGEDSNAQTNAGFSPLIHASIIGHTAIAKFLLDARADINAQTDAGASALLYASFMGHEEIVKLLLEAGADAKSQADAGALALMLAFNGHYFYGTAMKLLLDAKVDTRSEPYWQFPEVFFKNLNRGGHRSIVKMLLEAGAYKNMQTPDDIPPFGGQHRDSMMDYLLRIRADSQTI